MKIVLLFFFTCIAATSSFADELVIISPHWDGLRQEIRSGFQRWLIKQNYPPVETRFLDVGGGSDILKYLHAQFGVTPDSIGVDVLWGGGTDPFLNLEKLGLLAHAELPLELKEAFPASLHGTPLRGNDDTWYAVTLSAFGILYNKKLLTTLHLPFPHSWEELASPKAFSWVSSADPRKSASAHVVYEIILQAYGWEKGWKILLSMAANTRSFSSHSAQTPKEVAIGEVAYGFVIDSYGAETVRRVGEDNVGFIIPENLSALSGDGVALLKGAPHFKEAKKFIEYLFTQEAQTILMAKKGTPGGPEKYELSKMSVRPELYSLLGERKSISANPFEWHPSFHYDPLLASKRWNLLNELIGTFLIQGNEQLKVTQEHLIGQRSSLLEEGIPPLSEQAAEEIITSDLLTHGTSRNQLLLEWNNRLSTSSSLSWEKKLIRYLPIGVMSAIFLFALVGRLIKRIRLR